MFGFGDTRTFFRADRPKTIEHHPPEGIIESCCSDRRCRNDPSQACFCSPLSHVPSKMQTNKRNL